LDRYGVWPAAISAAGRHGVAGYLLRFPDWASAAWCLEQGLPVIASVTYGAGELVGAAMPETSGHLLVLTGCEGDEVLVNDPAGPAAARDTRRTRGGRIALRDLLAVAARAHQEAAARCGRRGAKELPRAVGYGGAHGQTPLATP